MGTVLIDDVTDLSITEGREITLAALVCGLHNNLLL